MSTPVAGHLLAYGEDTAGPSVAAVAAGVVAARTAGGDSGARPNWSQVSGGPGNTAAVPPGNVQPTRAGTAYVAPATGPVPRAAPARRPPTCHSDAQVSSASWMVPLFPPPTALATVVPANFAPGT